MENINNKDLILNIAVNLGRISKYATDGNKKRVETFLDDNNVYLNELETRTLNDKFTKTFKIFKKDYKKLSQNIELNKFWAEDIFTWANILTHRARFA